MKSILLDTNAYARLMAGDKSVLEILGRAETVFLSAIVCGELLDGFKGGTREKENRRLLTHLRRSRRSVFFR